MNPKNKPSMFFSLRKSSMKDETSKICCREYLKAKDPKEDTFPVKLK